MADPKTEHLLLCSWGLSSLCEAFINADIDYVALEALTSNGNNHIVEQLIPSLGKRAIFSSRLNQHFAKPLIVYNESIDSILPLSQVSTLPCSPDSVMSSERCTSMQSTSSFSFGSLELHNQSSIINCQPIDDSFKVVTTSNNKPQFKEFISSTELPIYNTNSIIGKIPYPANLPELDGFLQKVVSNGGSLLNHSHAFIRRFGENLYHTTDGKPSAKDYQNYSRSMIDTYPMFMDVSKEKSNASVIQQLSHFIRNKKYSEKRKLSPDFVYSKKLKRVYNSVSNNTNSKDQSHSQKKSSLDVKEIPSMSELHSELLKNGTANSSHVKLLLRKTAAERRQASNDALTCSDILSKYPHFKNFDMFMYDFSLLNLETCFEQVVEKLAALFDFAVTDELSKLMLFQTLNKKLHSKKPSKGNRSIITIDEAGSEIDLINNELQGPCLATYHSAGAITDVFLLAEGQTIVHGVSKTAEDAIILLIGSYFLFNRSYPTPYDSFLTFIERVLLGVKANPNYRGSITYNKYMKLYCQA